jgi:hypothetical protein
MDGQFRGKLAMAGELPAVQVGDDEILRSKRALIHASGSGENAVIIEPHGEVSFAGNDVPALVHPAPHDANLAAVLFLALRVTGQK